MKVTRKHFVYSRHCLSSAPWRRCTVHSPPPTGTIPPTRSKKWFFEAFIYLYRTVFFKSAAPTKYTKTHFERDSASPRSANLLALELWTFVLQQDAWIRLLTIQNNNKSLLHPRSVWLRLFTLLILLSGSALLPVRTGNVSTVLPVVHSSNTSPNTNIEKQWLKPNQPVKLIQ